jgi:hypothetical protein
VPRHVVSRSPTPVKHAVSDAIAASVYYPLARTARALERLGMDVSNAPLSFYRDQSFYVMRNDALDRFGTRLEQRFTAAEIRTMMNLAGLDVASIYGPPYWITLGYRRR